MSNDKSINWIQRLCKWRTVFAGWQLGTRAKGDPECDSVRDHRELTMIMRAEISAISQLLVRNGVFTYEEYTEQVQEEAKFLCNAYERRFPGFKATDDGLDINPHIAADTTAGWKP